MVKLNKVAEDISSAPFRMLAERYRAFDVPIFPCNGDDGKKPLVKWAKFQNELPSGKEIAQWLKRFPNANIALVTGRLSNITVIDSDNPDVKLEELFGMFGETSLAVFTPRGGYHLYYRYNGERNALSYGFENIDIRGEGGFVIVPPSKNPISGRSYEFVEGDISSLQDLPFLKGNLNVDAIVPAQSVTLGKRNKAVFSFLRIRQFYV